MNPLALIIGTPNPLIIDIPHNIQEGGSLLEGGEGFTLLQFVRILGTGEGFGSLSRI